MGSAQNCKQKQRFDKARRMREWRFPWASLKTSRTPLSPQHPARPEKRGDRSLRFRLAGASGFRARRRPGRLSSLLEPSSMILGARRQAGGRRAGGTRSGVRRQAASREQTQREIERHTHTTHRKNTRQEAVCRNDSKRMCTSVCKPRWRTDNCKCKRIDTYRGRDMR